MQEYAQTVGDALHYGGGVGQSVQSGSNFDQNASAAMLLAGELVQAEGLESAAKLRRQDCDFGDRIIIKARAYGALQKCDGPNRLSRNHERRGQCGMRVDGSKPGITLRVKMIDEKGPTLLNRIHRNGCVARAPANSSK